MPDTGEVLVGLRQPGALQPEPGGERQLLLELDAGSDAAKPLTATVTSIRLLQVYSSTCFASSLTHELLFLSFEVGGCIMRFYLSHLTEPYHVQHTMHTIHV